MLKLGRNILILFYSGFLQQAYLGAQLHEVGHNLGLRHAWDDGNEYGGTTGYMGTAPQEVNYPLQCYNGQNHWFLGWHDSRTFDVSPGDPVMLKIAAFVDYSLTRADEYTVVKVNDLYLQYNRAKNFNKDTREMADKLTIVEDLEVGTELVDGIDELGGAIAVFDGKNDLVIEVCDVVVGTDTSADLMLVSVGYDASLCDETIPETVTTPQPTPRPTPQPTLAPSQRPTFQPTIAPTFHPSASPSTPVPVDDEPTVADPPERSAPKNEQDPPPTNQPTDDGGSSPRVTDIQNVPERSGSKLSATVISCLLFAILAMLILAFVLVRRHRRKKRLYGDSTATKSSEDTKSMSTESFRTMPSSEELNACTEDDFPGVEVLARSREAFSLFAKATADKVNQLTLFHPVPVERVSTDDVSLCDPMDALDVVFPDPFPKETQAKSALDDSSTTSSFVSNSRYDESSMTSSFVNNSRYDEFSIASSSVNKPPRETIRITGIQWKRTPALEDDSELYFR